MAREDKPLWSCVELHRAGVMSIAWYSSRTYDPQWGAILLMAIRFIRVGEDTLITHDRPALMDSEGDHEPGAVVLWKWNSLRRFFPLGHDKGWQTQPDLVGVAAVSAHIASPRPGRTRTDVDICRTFSRAVRHQPSPSFSC